AARPRTGRGDRGQPAGGHRRGRGPGLPGVAARRRLRLGGVRAPARPALPAGRVPRRGRRPGGAAAPCGIPLAAPRRGPGILLQYPEFLSLMPYTPILATLGYVLSPDGRRVLLVHRNRRPDDAHLGKYNGLGGKLHPDEDVVACLRREIREEADIE